MLVNEQARECIDGILTRKCLYLKLFLIFPMCQVNAFFVLNYNLYPIKKQNVRDIWKISQIAQYFSLLCREKWIEIIPYNDYGKNSQFYIYLKTIKELKINVM